MNNPLLRTPPLSASAPNIPKLTDGKAKKRQRLDDDDGVNDFKSFKDEMREMLASMMEQQSARFERLEKNVADIKGQTSEIKTSNTDIEKSLDFLSAQVIDIEKKISSFEDEKKKLNVKVAEIDERVDALERNTRKTCIEIRSVPKAVRESKQDLFNSIAKIATTLSMENLPTYIRDAYRLPSKDTAQTATVVVEFSNALTKETFLKTVKSFNKTNKNAQLNASHLGYSGTNPIFISEHLSPKNKRLHFLAREFAKRENFRFCWISNGRVFLRKDEGYKYILVKNETSLYPEHINDEDEPK
ncbi:uncharacterized protein LOC119690504 [Plutella xylostella]|nr:uncharacterized protein LOC119690504 [Plutella xylostella]